MRCLPAAGSIIIAVCVPAFAASTPVHDDALCSGPPGALRAFHENVGEYAALHRLLRDRVAASAIAPDVKAVSAARDTLAASLRLERPNARQGSILTPPIVQTFDCRIAGARLRLRGEGDGVWRTLEPGRTPAHPTINETYPDHVLEDPPMFVLRALPPLPEELEYRIFDRDLVLWDIFARMVIDYVPAAVPALMTGEDDW